MPAKKAAAKKAAPRRRTPKKETPPPVDVFLEVDDKRLPFVHYSDWTIDDLFAVEGVLPPGMTAASAFDKFVGSTHAAGTSPHLFALVWFVAVRHSGERISWPRVKAEVDGAERLNIDFVEADPEADSPEA